MTKKTCVCLFFCLFYIKYFYDLRYRDYHKFPLDMDKAAAINGIYKVFNI